MCQSKHLNTVRIKHNIWDWIKNTECKFNLYSTFLAIPKHNKNDIKTTAKEQSKLKSGVEKGTRQRQVFKISW